MGTEQLPNLINKLGYDIIIPSWWMNTTLQEPNEHSIAVMVEEITHFLTQFGYGPRYPNEFGVENWSSIIAQEAFNAQCDWWQHPENDCPNSPAQYSGDCFHPNCDVVRILSSSSYFACRYASWVVWNRISYFDLIRSSFMKIIE